MAVTEAEALRMFEDFVNGRLTKDEWTHEAHLVTAWVALRDRTPAEALTFLRDAITTHNCGIGIRNDAVSGYHETLTVYYVGAVHDAAAGSVAELFEVPGCHRDAPLAYWRHDRLWSTDARQRFIAPDVGELPWPTEAILAA